MVGFDLPLRIFTDPLESRKVKTVEAIHAKRAKKRKASAAWDSRQRFSEPSVILLDLR